MHQLLHSRSTYILLAVSVIGLVGLMAIAANQDDNTTRVTAAVDRGDVEQLVTVSGIIEAEQTANLAFPVTGIVREVDVREGDQVQTGDALISLNTRILEADLADAIAARNRAVATRDELESGADAVSRNATEETITLKQTSLETTIATQEELVRTARQTLLSQGLAAESSDPEEEAVPPTISGTYQCTEEGSYVIETFGSASQSGYSFRLSGIETGTYEASVEQAISFGDCGLRIIFDPNSQYRNTTWTVTIPNPNAPQYVINRNAYALALTQADSAIRLAEQDLALTQANATSANAPARQEALTRAAADITSANARIARVTAQIEDRTLRAPFAGTITDIDILPGETVTTAPVVTLLGASAFELTARIPEIDIGKLAIGQPVRAVFDAKADEVLTGEVTFISLQATEIDGVAYYEALISLDEAPTWLRSGLNADIDIVVQTASDVLRIPRRFVTTIDNTSSVQLLTGTTAATTTVDVLLFGDDGYVAITGNLISPGAIVTAPQ